ncbi:hypothetical protein NM208_g15429 [Fusarium decemcellulare]|uniref:Uncharacterized protein n=1 Tax=Fusarium decemcellulare TaxID=57161 RepID=A0ACC1RD17_9HYPO|nr:hypothetical protein NM208_g15429 [Fusarium decemcellulare]
MRPMVIWYKWKLRGTKIKHEFVSGGPHIREDTEVVADLIAKGKIRAVYTTVDLADLDEVTGSSEQLDVSHAHPYSILEIKELSVEAALIMATLILEMAIM